MIFLIFLDEHIDCLYIHLRWRIRKISCVVFSYWLLLRLAPNGTNTGLFQIRFQYTLAHFPDLLSLILEIKMLHFNQIVVNRINVFIPSIYTTMCSVTKTVQMTSKLWPTFHAKLFPVNPQQTPQSPLPLKKLDLESLRCFLYMTMKHEMNKRVVLVKKKGDGCQNVRIENVWEEWN